MSHRLLSCMIVFFCLTAARAQNRLVPESATSKLENLEARIAVVELTSGSAAIGGAAIEDVLALLRRSATFPICLEMREYTKEADGLTLAAALNELHELKARGNLNSADAGRLQEYEKLAVNSNLSTLVGFKKKTFALTRQNISLRDLLDDVTVLDPDYAWKNFGTDRDPLIVLQPRNGSILGWSIPSSCGGFSSARSLFGTGGKLTALFQEHNITRAEVNGGNKVPDVDIDLCRDHLIARDVLNLTVTAAGHSVSWTVSGIRGLRWLTFE